MTQRDHSPWQGDYVSLLQRLQPPTATEPGERRGDPRIDVAGQLTVEHDGRAFALLDISAGGAAFVVDDALVALGQATLSLNGAFNMLVELLPSGAPIPSAAGDLSRGRVRFLDVEQGLLYVSLAMMLLDAAPSTPVP